MIVIMGAAAVTVMTMEVAVVRRIGVIVVGVAVAMVWNMCDVVEGTEKAVMVEVMGKTMLLLVRGCVGTDVSSYGRGTGHGGDGDSDGGSGRGSRRGDNRDNSSFFS